MVFFGELLKWNESIKIWIYIINNISLFYLYLYVIPYDWIIYVLYLMSKDWWDLWNNLKNMTLGGWERVFAYFNLFSKKKKFENKVKLKNSQRGG